MMRDLKTIRGPVLCFLTFFSLAYPAAAAETNWWSNCVGIKDDAARLHCFDTSVPKTDSSSGDVFQGAAGAERQRDDPSPAERPDASAWRVSAGYGLGVAGQAGSFKTLGGRLRSDSGFGTEGSNIDAQLWKDGWIGDDWSVGLEYLHLANRGRISLDLPNGISILTNPVEASAAAKINGDVGFANIAWRPASDGLLQADIGAGLGFGDGSAKSDIVVDNAFVGLRTSISQASSPFAAPQAFADVALPVYSDYYLSLGAKALFVTGHPVDLDQRYLDVILSVSVGRKF